MNLFTVGSFLFFTSFVAVISYFLTRKEKLDTQDGYFLGGRNLGAWVIAGSLMLTNLSTEQLVGLNAQGYSDTIAVMGWEVGAAISLVIVAFFLLPRYLKGGITTIPDFLEERYDFGTKQIVTILFLFGYVFNLLPPILYSGAVALNGVFNIPEVLGIGRTASIWVTVFGIGTIGAIYAIFGGLKAVAVSDTINGVGLLIGGLMIPIIGLFALGDGSFTNGFQIIVENSPEKLNSVGDSSSPVPFGTMFTGMLLVNLFYWGTAQHIMQRAISAKNLKEGQKGVLIAAFLKLLGPVFLILPGIIAYNMFGPGIEPTDAYPMLVQEVLPKPLVGFFAAVLFGAILSSFNSALNSSVTLIALNIYKPYFNPNAPDHVVVRKGKYVGIVLALFAMCIAPLIDKVPQGFFQYLQIVNGFYNVPIFTILIVGYLTKRVPAIAAKVSLFVFISVYATTQLIWDTGVHFLHILGILFVVCTTMMLIIGRIAPRDTAYILEEKAKVDMTPWKLVYPVGIGITAAMILIYVLLSPVGII
ncbi:AraC family transcriptional regulator [Pontibacillus halophilus JSM 076056 = DSM 19796]|uniref:AraC family transcriptional regulator n=1 Tax=Pontibacillus halophilus JSM 076056 = DSM 19796 TaxID=1385510 RepID=A0A0A5GKA1_9BACI|nr:solute:sodium symporter family transporter [Pontibacillus halophilus]KGX91658.1 AraC family transcriptional regulator [Pontibacillus halophilus JSM 076056 = DSM 19796]